MARIERSKKGKSKDSEGSSPKKEPERTFEDYRKENTGKHSGRKSRGKSRSSGRESRSRRSSGRESRGKRDFRGKSRSKRDFEMTKVTCSSCGVECEVPFKPTSTKPVYCSDCFVKKGKDKPDKPSDRDLDIINEKLNKIMKALKIE